MNPFVLAILVICFYIGTVLDWLGKLSDRVRRMCTRA